MTAVTFSKVKPDNIEMLWPKLEPLIISPIEYSNGELSIDSIKERALEGELEIVTITGEDLYAVITMEVRVFPTGLRILALNTVGGNGMDKWMEPFSEILDALAIERGCTESYIVGRPAWAKALKKVGFEHIHTVVSRKVGG